MEDEVVSEDLPLMTPTATVWRMSRTAKRPRGGYCWKDSTHMGLVGDHVDEGGVTGLDELGVVLDGLAGSAVDLLGDLVELAGNVGGVAVEDGA